MKGWVYVISNNAMHGLVKVGFSMNDPEKRAEELNHTGTPHPYVVEYEVLIEEPYKIEQAAHKLLSSKHEGKEWFRCSSEEAVAAIKQVSGPRIITETYKRGEKAKPEARWQTQALPHPVTQNNEHSAAKSQLLVSVERSIERKAPTTEPTGKVNPISIPNKESIEQAHEHLAAMGGDTTAQVFLGMRYLDGRCSSPQDDAQAVAWFHKAATQGNAEGQFRLGWMYKLGRGVPQDPVNAYIWGSLAMSHGESRAGAMCDELAKQLNPSQLAQAKAMAHLLEAKLLTGGIRVNGPPRTERALRTTTGRVGRISAEDFVSLNIYFPEITKMLANDLNQILLRQGFEGNPSLSEGHEFIAIKNEYPDLAAMLSNDLSKLIENYISGEEGCRVNLEDLVTLKIEFPELAEMLANDLNRILGASKESNSENKGSRPDICDDSPREL